MSLPPETMLELMQYADGELEGEARVRIESLLETSAEARAVVEAMGTLGEVVREAASERARSSAGPGDSLVEAVMATIAREPEGAFGGRAAGHDGRANVVPFGPPAPLAHPSRKVRAGGASALVAALALAAGVVLFARSKEPAPTRGDMFASAPPSAISGPAPASAASSEGVAQLESGGIDLEEVRSIRNKVNVFFTPPPQTAGSAAQASVVIWIDDSDGKQGAP